MKILASEMTNRIITIWSREHALHLLLTTNRQFNTSSYHFQLEIRVPSHQIREENAVLQYKRNNPLDARKRPWRKFWLKKVFRRAEPLPRSVADCRRPCSVTTVAALKDHVVELRGVSPPPPTVSLSPPSCDHASSATPVTMLLRRCFCGQN
jgi:hypothetical protein